MTELLKLRKQIKKKKPEFVRQKHLKKALKKRWRQPKGGQSKLRRKFKGHIKHPSMGFSSPKAVRHLHPSGLKPKIIFNISQLKDVKKDEGIIIASLVGQKKKLELIKKIKELKLPLLNIKNIDEFVKKVEEKQKEKKTKQKQIQEKKAQKEKEAEKKTKEKKEKEEPAEEKEKKEKEEKRKVLEAKQ